MSKGNVPSHSVHHKAVLDSQQTTRSQQLAFLQLLLRSRHGLAQSNGFAADGFTLVELLVSIIVGGIISIALLFSAVQLMGTNQREAARSDTQREVQAALDYIARDLKEAVYVYDGQCLLPGGGRKLIASNDAAQGNCLGLLNNLPAQLNQPNNLPILAFWRVDPIPDPLVTTCVNNAAVLATPPAAGVAKRPIDEVNCGAKRMYTLVVYSLNNDDAPARQDQIWRGRARITRYQLPKYAYSAGLTITPGWLAPDGTESSFLSWPRAGANGVTRLGLAANALPARATYWDNKVLVDFIDNKIAGAAALRADVQCPPGPQGGPVPAPFIPTPDPQGAYAAPATALPRNVFYACVRGSGGGPLNQEVLVRIRANAAGRAGLDRDSTELPLTMETRVLTRGVVGKDT